MPFTKREQTIYTVAGTDYLDYEIACTAARRHDLMKLWEDNIIYGNIDAEVVVENCLAKRDELVAILDRNYASFFERQESE